MRIDMMLCKRNRMERLDNSAVPLRKMQLNKNRRNHCRLLIRCLDADELEWR